MSGIEKINQKILSDAQADSDRETASAKAEADQILAKAQADAKAAQEKIAAKAKEDAAELIRRQVSVAELEARKMRLSAKQEMIDKAFDAALSELVNMPRDTYVSFLTDKIAEIAQGGEEVILNAKDKEEIGLKLIAAVGLKNLKHLQLKMVTLSSETKNIPGGFILRSGDVEIDCSLSTMVQGCRDEVLPEVVSALFA